MTKVYPNATAPVSEKPKLKLNASPTSTLTPTSDDNSVVVLTVWKKSLLFNCDGFTVFNAHGNLVFRVDNYSAATKAEIILMDPSGKSLLTIRRKRLSLSGKWLMYEGETAVNPILSARKHVNLLNTKSLARVSSCCSSGTGTTGSSSSSSSPSNSIKNVMIYEIEGSYTQRCCAVYDGKRRRVAEIKRKEAVGGVDFGMDVFRLIVKQPEIDSSVAMAVVILLDQMFGSSKRLST
ncbi:protein LURP-one-related 8 [Camellia sinensis]|uniref:protein LURP-one-related 8 n=1 Tax=Camellia sinensis TaxID=4442 RepID=UPI0010358B9C|nr:protein LURP-one-related 8 [Camellia sinensis]